mmetsp:Transcript_82465/g.191575  ORF Transcript_82465/g.191575 Transcript_82465/m.191575 type:complete len:242 (-) Transcript_82465:1002-1727(-)
MSPHRQKRWLCHVERSQTFQRLPQDGHRSSLICHDLLELVVLSLALFARALERHVRLGNIGAKLFDFLLDSFKRTLQAGDLGLHVLLLACLFQGCVLVLINILLAGLVLIILLLLLHLQLSDHFVHCLLHLLEAIQLHSHGKSCQVPSASAALLVSGHCQELRRCPCALLLGAASASDLHEAQRLRKKVSCVVFRQDLDCLSDCLHLFCPRLAAFRIFSVCSRATLLQVHKEFLIGTESLT